MNNFIIGVKRFFTNKNTVTILGVIIIIGIIYFGYNSQIKKATSPIQIPVAKETIQPRTLITQNMIKTISIPSVAVSSNVIRSTSSIVGKYSAINSVIPAGSMFYTDTVVSAENMPDSIYTNIKEGEVPYNFPVTTNTTYGNSITPDSYIDIYMKAVDTNGQIMVGKLLENVKVLAVKDSTGNNVFENTSSNRTPAFLYFGVTDDIHILLRKASYLSSKAVVLFPVPHGMTVEDEDLTTNVSTQYLRDFINANTVVIDETPTDSTDDDTDIKINVGE